MTKDELAEASWETLLAIMAEQEEVIGGLEATIRNPGSPDCGLGAAARQRFVVGHVQA